MNLSCAESSLRFEPLPPKAKASSKSAHSKGKILICTETDCQNQVIYPGTGPTSLRCVSCKSVRTRRQARVAMQKHRANRSKEDIEKDKINYKKYYDKNVNNIRAKSLAWYRSNKERCTANRKNWELNNPDYNRIWVENNRDRHNAKKHRRRAREHSAFVEHVDLSVVYKRDRGMCYLCSRQVPRVVKDKLSPSLDHVIALSRGGLHSYENVRLAHWICNARKGAGEVMPNAFT